MRHTHRREPVVANAENKVTLEINAVDVGGDNGRRKAHAEPQRAILEGQREKMRHKRGAHVIAQAFDGVGHHRGYGSIATEQGTTGPSRRVRSDCKRLKVDSLGASAATADPRSAGSRTANPRRQLAAASTPPKRATIGDHGNLGSPSNQCSTPAAIAVAPIRPICSHRLDATSARLLLSG